MVVALASANSLVSSQDPDFSKEGPQRLEGEWIVRYGVAGGCTGGGRE